jgi:hypothetical protein
MATPASKKTAAEAEIPAHDNIRGKNYFQQSLQVTKKQDL